MSEWDKDDGTSSFVRIQFCHERHGELCRRIQMCEDACNKLHSRVDGFHNKLMTIILLMCGNLLGLIISILLRFIQF